MMMTRGSKDGSSARCDVPTRCPTCESANLDRLTASEEGELQNICILRAVHEELTRSAREEIDPAALLNREDQRFIRVLRRAAEQLLEFDQAYTDVQRLGDRLHADALRDTLDRMVDAFTECYAHFERYKESIGCCCRSIDRLADKMGVTLKSEACLSRFLKAGGIRKRLLQTQNQLKHDGNSLEPLAYRFSPYIVPGFMVVLPTIDGERKFNPQVHTHRRAILAGSEIRHFYWSALAIRRLLLDHMTSLLDTTSLLDSAAIDAADAAPAARKAGRSQFDTAVQIAQSLGWILFGEPQSSYIDLELIDDRFKFRMIRDTPPLRLPRTQDLEGFSLTTGDGFTRGFPHPF